MVGYFFASAGRVLNVVNKIQNDLRLFWNKLLLSGIFLGRQVSQALAFRLWRLSRGKIFNQNLSLRHNH